MNPLDHPLRVTLWLDATARTKTEESLSLRQLCGRIRDTTARDKGALPWLKLAEFGDLRTEKGCLRNGRNVGFVWGVEGDYDGKEVSPDEAVQRLQAARLAAVVYTSPSHRPDAPKWRVLCPLADPALPEERESLVARLNGALGGILAGESYVLAQSFYFGSVAGNPAHRVLTVEGRYLDLATDIASAPKARAERDPVASGGVVLPTDDTAPAVALASACAMFDDAADGTGRHQLLLAATNRVARFVAGGYLDGAEAVAVLQGAMAGSGRDANDNEVESALGGAVRCVVVPWYPPVDAADEFAGFGIDPPKAVAAPSPFYRDEADPYAGRKWLAYQLLPERGVALLAGVSRVGKTFAGLDLALSVTTGTPFAGREIDRPGGVLYLAAEGAAEIPVRWKAAKAARGFAGVDLPFLWVDVLPCKLLEAGAAERFVALAKAAAADIADSGKPLSLIVIDTLAVAGGWEDENSAAQAQKAMDVLHAMSRATGAMVVGIDHHGKNVESGTRGSSAKPANADAALALLADADSNGTLSNRRLLISKCRGGPEGQVIPFALPAVMVGRDDKGRAVTTCTVDWNAEPARRPDKLPRGAKGALAVLMELVEAACASRVLETDWRRMCADDRRVCGTPDAKSQATAFRRAYETLIDCAAVGAGGGYVWVRSAGDEFPSAPASVATNTTSSDKVAFVAPA